MKNPPQNGITTQRRDLQIPALYDCPVKNPRLFISQLTYSESQDSASPLKTCTTPSQHFSVSLFKMNGLPSLHKCFPLRKLPNIKYKTNEKNNGLIPDSFCRALILKPIEEMRRNAGQCFTLTLTLKLVSGRIS